MKKVTLKKIKEHNAQDITTISAEACEGLRNAEGGFDTILLSFGTYGMNGAVIQGRNTNSLYKVTARSTNLFYFV